jgi:RimJ/RimL family protein N-acetyltransferase
MQWADYGQMGAGDVELSMADVAFTVAAPSESPEVAALYASLSESSITRRFMVTMSPEALVLAASWNAASDITVLLARTGGHLVGEGRYERAATGDYEFAITVADAHHRKGIGTGLLRQLQQHARGRGIPTLRASVRGDNIAMIQLLRAVGCALVEPVDESGLVVEIATDSGMPGWPAEGTAPRVLIESGAAWDDPATAELRDRGFEVRRCLGPKRDDEQTCPLITEGSCRLVEGAQYVACLLPTQDPNAVEVAQHHERSANPHVVARSIREWAAVAASL